MQHNSRLAPEYVHHLYDDADCRAFIAAHFDAEVLQAYDALIPAAFRADLWRYCVIFVNGGVYMDAKYRLTRPLDDWLPGNDDGVFVLERDLPGFWREGEFGIHNAFFACAPGDPMLYGCIRQIVRNVQARVLDRRDGLHSAPLFVTGPGLLCDQYKRQHNDTVSRTAGWKELRGRFRLFFTVTADDTAEIVDKHGRALMAEYPEYRAEQQQHGGQRYTLLWHWGQVYN